MANKEDFLSKANRMSWSRFLASDEGKAGLQYLRLACPRRKEKDDATLIRNAIGFDFWHECVDDLESLGEVPKKPEKEEEDRLDP